MAFPGVPQGTLNRLKASLVVPDDPALNVTASFLGDEGIGIDFDGDSTLFINTLTGAVTSPEPYIKVNITVHLLKSQALAESYKAQMESDARIGNFTVWTDAPDTLPNYQFVNGAIQHVDRLSLNGRDAGYRITIGGYYPINNNLWSQ